MLAQLVVNGMAQERGSTELLMKAEQRFQQGHLLGL